MTFIICYMEIFQIRVLKNRCPLYLNLIRYIKLKIVNFHNNAKNKYNLTFSNIYLCLTRVSCEVATLYSAIQILHRHVVSYFYPDHPYRPIYM